MALLKEIEKASHYVAGKPDMTILEAAKLLTQHNCGAMLILDKDDGLAGIFTERDLLKRVVAESKDTSELVSTVMTANVITVDNHDSVEHCHTKLLELKCRNMPVTEDSKVVGLVSMEFIMEWLANKFKGENEMLQQYIHS